MQSETAAGLELAKQLRNVSRACKIFGYSRDSCLPKNYKYLARFVFRNPYQDEIDRIRERQRTEYLKFRLLERKWKIEDHFGEAKENRRLMRAGYRSLNKTQVRVYMIATVQSLKRLVTFFVLLLKELIFTQNQ